MSVPAWPDFEVERSDGLGFATSEEIWAGRTDTGRPDTPIFTVLITGPRGLSEETARGLLSDALWTRYNRAHPKGCPAR